MTAHDLGLHLPAGSQVLLTLSDAAHTAERLALSGGVSEQRTVEFQVHSAAPETHAGTATPARARVATTGETVWVCVQSGPIPASQSLQLALDIVGMLARSSVASVHVAAGARFKASRDAVHVLDLNGISAPDSGLPRLASPGLLQDDLVRAFVELVRLEGIPARVLVWPTVRNSPDSVAETSTAIAREIKRLYGIDVAVSDGSVRDSALEPMSLDAQKRSKFESLYV